MFRTEMAHCNTNRHPNILRLLGSFTEPGVKMCIVLELCPHGSLLKYIRTTRVTDADVANIACGVARGMDHLHARCRVLQRDLKASNILLDLNLTPKVRPVPWIWWVLRLFASPACLSFPLADR